MDQRLDTLSEPHERLRWARIQWQEKSGVKPDAKAAAESLGMQPHTYRAYERSVESAKHTRLDHNTAIRCGRKYGVSWGWLLTGEGDPLDIELSQKERQVIVALRQAPEDRQTAVADAITQLLNTA